MKTLIRFSLALFAVCSVYSTSQALWWHKAKSCAPAAPAVPCYPETQEYTTTRYRKVVTYVPEQVVTRVTTWVPAGAPMAAAPAGCSGSRGSCYGSGPATRGMGCSGSSAAPAGCNGYSAAPAGCSGSGGKSGFSMGSLPDPQIAQLESRLDRIDAKLSALTVAVNAIQNPSPAQDKVVAPNQALPALPTLPANPTGSAKPALSPETDPLLAAARAYKANRDSLPEIPFVSAPIPADGAVTRK